MKVNKVTNAHCLRGVAAQPASSSGEEEEEEEKNMTPATHTLPPSLNYHRRVAHTAGDDEEKNALRGREGSGRERREWRIIALELCARACVSVCLHRIHKVAGPRWWALKDPFAPFERSLAPPRGFARAAATPPTNPSTPSSTAAPALPPSPAPSSSCAPIPPLYYNSLPPPHAVEAEGFLT